jgi:hypothetical protein
MRKSQAGLAPIPRGHPVPRDPRTGGLSWDGVWQERSAVAIDMGLAVLPVAVSHISDCLLPLCLDVSQPSQDLGLLVVMAAC